MDDGQRGDDEGEAKLAIFVNVKSTSIFINPFLSLARILFCSFSRNRIYRTGS